MLQEIQKISAKIAELVLEKVPTGVAQAKVTARIIHGHFEQEASYSQKSDDTGGSFAAFIR